MIELFNSLKRHQFFTLSSGVLIAQLLSLAFMPWLTRLYPVESFGYYAVYLASANLIGLFSTLRLEMTIPLAEAQVEADGLSSLCAGMALVVGLAFLAVFTLPWSRAALPALHESIELCALIAASSIFLGWIQVTTQRILRNGQLKFISVRHITEKSSFVILALLGAKFGFSVTGLIVAQTTGYFLSVVVLLAGSPWRPKIPWGSVRLLIAKYSDFPKYNTLSMALQLASSQLPTLFYSHFFPVQSLGFLNLAQRVAEAPTTLVTSGLGTVFYRRVLSAPKTAFRRIFLRALAWCFGVFLLPALAVAYFAQPLLEFAFGTQWGESTPFFLALIPPTVARLSFTLFQGIIIVLRRLDLDLRISAMVLVAQIGGIGLGLTLTDSLIGPVMIASALTTMVFGYSLILVYRLAGEQSRS